MKRALLILSPICLAFVSGVALVVACGGSATSSAQSSSGHRVVDSNGLVLGSLVGSGLALASTYNANGAATPVLAYPFVHVHSFVDSNRRIWSVYGNGQFIAPIASMYYASTDCTGPAYIEQGDPNVVRMVLIPGGTFWVQSGTATLITPASHYPAGSRPGTCEPYPVPASSVTTITATPVSSLVSVIPPLIVPPVTID